MFDNIGINENCTRELQEAVNSGRLSHAVILEGADEQTRLQAARELAAAIVCAGNEKPCKKCPHCRKAFSDCHPDIHILTRDKKDAIRVDEIRRLKALAQLYPNEASFCVFIISEAQFMGIQAQNALLKIFEEPAAHVRFILTCESKSSLLETIASRGSIYRLSYSEFSALSVDKDDPAREIAMNLCRCLCSLDEYNFLKLTAVFQKDKDLLKKTLVCLSLIFRDAATLSTGFDGEIISGFEETARALSMNFTLSKLIEYTELVQKLLNSVKANSNHNLLITRLCSSFYQIKNA